VLMQHLIEFLIPSYKRFEGVVAAALSVAEQILHNRYEDIVRVSIVDDASPGFDKEKLVKSLGNKSKFINISSNATNKGMSRNIYDMVAGSSAEFCAVLTDDDWLIDGKLLEIVEYLRSIASKKEVGGLFTPRYSYLESGELHCVVCKPFLRDHLIRGGHISAMRYCHNGFILTGFIFRPAYFAWQEWSDNSENGFFPVINLGFILSRYSLLYVNQNWFHHTVLNQCHWDSWGSDQLSQTKRLHRDYLHAITILASKLSCKASLRLRIEIHWYECLNYFRHLRLINLSFRDKVNQVSIDTRARAAFFFAVLLCPIYLSMRFLRSVVFFVLNVMKKVFFSKSEF